MIRNGGLPMMTIRFATASGSALALLWAAPGSAQFASGAAETSQSASEAFVPADFAVPTRVEGPGFKLVPLGPDLVRIDFEAYMSSIEHLQKTFTRSTAWPHPNISDADAMKDMVTEQGRFQRRESFAYAVLTPDGKRERGCVYVYPSPVPGYDAMVTLWVTKAEFDAGFDAELYAWTRQWIARAWPLRSIAYPGRAIDWGTWDALEAASAVKVAQ
jgi:hypothetical protein